MISYKKKLKSHQEKKHIICQLWLGYFALEVSYRRRHRGKQWSWKWVLVQDQRTSCVASFHAAWAPWTKEICLSHWNFNKWRVTTSPLTPPPPPPLPCTCMPLEPHAPARYCALILRLIYRPFDHCFSGIECWMATCFDLPWPSSHWFCHNWSDLTEESHDLPINSCIPV